jgi:hypothetical protein
MTASLLGELVLLPAMLCCRPGRRSAIADRAESTMENAVEFKVDTMTNEIGPEIHPFPAEKPAVPRRIRAAR